MTNGLLYVISTDATIKSFAGLKGRKSTVPFPNDTPELVFNVVLSHHGMKAGAEVEVDRAGTPIEAIQLLLAGRIEIALVPEPPATAAMVRGAASGTTVVHRAIDMQAEWGAVIGLVAFLGFVLLYGPLMLSRQERARRCQPPLRSDRKAPASLSSALPEWALQVPDQITA